MNHVKLFENYYNTKYFKIFKTILNIKGNVWICDYKHGQGLFTSLTTFLIDEDIDYQVINFSQEGLDFYRTFFHKNNDYKKQDVIIIDEVDRMPNWASIVTEMFLFHKRNPDKKFIFLSNNNSGFLDKPMVKEHLNVKKVEFDELFNKSVDSFKKINENLFENFPVLKDLKKYGLKYTLKDVKNYLNNKHQKEYYPFPEEFLLLNVIIGSRLAQYHFKECQKKRGKFDTWNWIKNIRKEDLDNLPLPPNVFEGIKKRDD